MSEYWDTLRLQSLLWLGYALVTGALLLMLFPEQLDDVFGTNEAHESIDCHFAFLILGATCFLPPVLARLGYSLINRKAAQQTVRLHVPSVISDDLAAAALVSWRYELHRIRSSLCRAESFAGLWGLIASVVLVACVTFLLPPFHAKPGSPFTQPYHMAAFAVTAAVATRFFLDLAHICVRNANDDMSKRMFAQAVRAMILTVIATLTLIIVAGLLGAEMTPKLDGGASAVLQSMGVGASVAMVGVPAFEYVLQRVSAMLGVKPSPQAVSTPLTSLAGINAGEVERLLEEGIESVECLINTPLPRIFLNTRFSLVRICDWFDQGVLLCRLGSQRATELRKSLGIVGALELRKFAVDGNIQRGMPIVATIKKTLRIENDDEVELLLNLLIGDEVVTMAHTFRQTQLLVSNGDEDFGAILVTA